mgnify:CR=1 FL=1
MPKKTNNRKAIQAAKRKADAVADARDKRKWGGNWQEHAPQQRVMIAQHSGGSAALLALLIAAGVLQAMVERTMPPA